ARRLRQLRAGGAGVQRRGYRGRGGGARELDRLQGPRIRGDLLADRRARPLAAPAIESCEINDKLHFVSGSRRPATVMPQKDVRTTILGEGAQRARRLGIASRENCAAGQVGRDGSPIDRARWNTDSETAGGPSSACAGHRRLLGRLGSVLQGCRMVLTD